MPPPGNDPNGYYSQYDHNGYYDRNGRYRRIRTRPRFRQWPPPPPPAYGPPPPSGAYYQQGRYEADCHRGNAAAGTIFGALAGGLIGGAAATAMAAPWSAAPSWAACWAIRSRATSIATTSLAFRVYADGLNGDLGQRYEWRNGGAYGYFTPTREFRRGGVVCRDFTETSYRRDGRSFTRTGTACRQTDGNWRFD